MPFISSQNRDKVVLLWQQGKSHTFIAREMGIARNSVQYITKKFRKYNSTEDLPKSGRPTKTSETEQHKLLLLSKFHPTWNAKQLFNLWNPTRSVSLTTAKNILRNYRLYGRIFHSKPKSTVLHRKSRLDFCAAYINWTSEKWADVIFTGATMIHLDLESGELDHPNTTRGMFRRFTTPKANLDDTGIMVWGAIKETGERMLIRVDGAMDLQEYQRILSGGLISLLESGSILQLDFAPGRHSKDILAYLEGEGICLLSDWPSQSTDINIMESIWEILKKELSVYKCNSNEELWNACQKEFSSISKSTISALYNTVPKRLAAIMCNHGYLSNP